MMIILILILTGCSKYRLHKMHAICMQICLPRSPTNMISILKRYRRHTRRRRKAKGLGWFHGQPVLWDFPRHFPKEKAIHLGGLGQPFKEGKGPLETKLTQLFIWDHPRNRVPKPFIPRILATGGGSHFPIIIFPSSFPWCGLGLGLGLGFGAWAWGLGFGLGLGLPFGLDFQVLWPFLFFNSGHLHFFNQVRRPWLLGPGPWFGGKVSGGQGFGKGPFPKLGKGQGLAWAPQGTWAFWVPWQGPAFGLAPERGSVFGALAGPLFPGPEN